MKKNSLKHFERLKSTKLIERLFSKEAKSVFEDGISLRYLLIENSDVPLQAGFSVSKKHYKKAVDRNRIKRWMRESYRTKKSELLNIAIERKFNLILFLILTKPMEEKTFQIVDQKIEQLISQLRKKLENHGSKVL